MEFMVEPLEFKVARPWDPGPHFCPLNYYEIILDSPIEDQVA